MKSAIIYGSAGTGKGIYEKVKDIYDVLYFVDENPARIGETNDGIPVFAREKIFETQFDFIIMGMLTGFEDAVKYLMSYGVAEGQIITKYVALSLRARRACLEGIAEILALREANGAVAEMGVYRGDFAKVINEIFSTKTLYLFHMGASRFNMLCTSLSISFISFANDAAPCLSIAAR